MPRIYEWGHNTRSLDGWLGRWLPPLPRAISRNRQGPRHRSRLWHQTDSSSGLLHPQVWKQQRHVRCPGQKQWQGWLGTKGGKRGVGRGALPSGLLTCARLYLRKHGHDLVAEMWMHSWGSRGRRFKSGRPRLVRANFRTQKQVHERPMGARRAPINSVKPLWEEITPLVSRGLPSP